MIDYIELVDNKELIPRKKITNFIEKIFRYIYDVNIHERYKEIVYCEKGCLDEIDYHVKRAYDSFIYMIFNRKNPITKEMLKVFWYIYSPNNEISEEIWIKIATKYMLLGKTPILEKALEISMLAYDEALAKEDKLILSLFLYNICLIRDNHPAIQLLCREIKNYEELILHKEKDKLYSFFLNVISNQKYQDKEYYKRLKEINKKDITTRIYASKRCLEEDYMVKHIYLYGSFSNMNARLDSDIDLLIQYNLDILEDEIEKITEELKEYLYKYFERYIDIHCMSEYINDEFIKNARKITKIF